MSLFKKKKTADDAEEMLREQNEAVEEEEEEEESEAPEKTKKQKIKTITSTQTFCPVLDVQDGVVLTRDNNYVKIMEISPINFDLRPVDEQDAIVGAFSSVLRMLPKKVHIKITSERADLTPYIQNIQDHMANEYNERCREQQAGQIELLRKTEKQDGTTHRFFLSFAYEGENTLISKRPSFNEIRASLNRDAFAIRAALENCGNSIISDGNDTEQTLNILYDIACRAMRDEKPFAEHKREVESIYTKEQLEAGAIIPVANYISPREIQFGLSPKYLTIDGRYVSYCYIPSRAYAVEQFGGWLEEVYNYMPGVDCDIWLQKEDISKVQNKLRFWVKNNKIKQKHTEETDVDYEAINEALDSGRFMKAALAGGDDFIQFAVMLTIHANTKEDLMYRYRLLRDHMLKLDLQLRYHVCKQTNAYLSSLPLVSYDPSLFNKARRNAPSSQLGSIYPFTAYELMDEDGFYLGENTAFGSPVCLNNFDTSKYQNANMLILGPSGSGKTYTLQTLLLRMRQMGHQVFAIAPLKATEYKPACEAIGGTYIRFAPGSGQYINIMDIRQKKNVIESRKKEGSLLTNKIQKVRTFCSLLVPDMTPQEAKIIDEVIRKTYNNFGITNDNNSLYDPDNPEVYRRMPILADLHEELRKAGPKAERMYDVMGLYVTGSVDCFNHETNVDLDSSYVVIDVEDMTEAMMPMGMFVSLDLIMDKVESDSLKRKCVAIDELWKLMKASKMSQEFVREIFKIIRGLNGAAIGATQDLNDVVSTDVGAAVINNTRIKILMQMDKKEADAVADVMDLTSSELEQLKRTGERRDKGKALFIANDNHVFIRIKTSKVEHDLITTDPRDLARIQAEKSNRVG